MADKRSKLVLGLFLISSVVVLALSIYTGLSLNSLVDSLEQSRSERLLAEAQAASLVVSAEELEAIQDAESLSSESAESLERRLDAFASLHNLTQVSFIRQLPSGELQYIISGTGAASEDATQTVTGAISQNASSPDISSPPFATNEMLEQVLKGAIVVADITQSHTDAMSLMAYSPVFGADGRVIAVAAVGVDDAVTIQADSRIRDLTLMLLLCVIIVIVAACANVLLQVRKEHELEESVNVQKLMIRVSQALSSERPFDERVDKTLSILGNYLGASRAYIVNVSEQNASSALRQHWNGDGSNPEADKNDSVALCHMMRETFSSDSTDELIAVSCSNVEQSYKGRYSLLRETKARAFIWEPLCVKNEMWGVLALDFAKPQNEFAKKDIQLVESAASDLVGAITRELYSEQREQALDHAVQASEAKSSFLSNMSHEMRTPMNAIVGMTTIALGSSEVDRKDYCLDHIKDASAHLLTIINDVLDMSSMQSDELSLKSAPFDIQQAIDKIIGDHIHKINEHSLRLSLELDERIPPVLIGDKLRITKVVSNLLSNAIKFTPDEGYLGLRIQHVGVSQEGHTLRFVVEDSGIGMDPATRDGLFGSFEQAESGANRRYGGTGLGLAIARRLVELMGGEMRVDSTLNEGSTFSFTITLAEDGAVSPASNGGNCLLADPVPQPAAVDTAGQDPSKLSAPQKLVALPTAPRVIPDLSDYRILLAEDIEINREVVLALLAESGIRIDITTNGVEAFEAIAAEPDGYDLVFMDLQMPEMDGLDATRKIRSISSQAIAGLPIIAMTANVLQEDIDACISAGMNDHVGKPISIEDVYEVLEKYLSKKL